MSEFSIIRKSLGYTPEKIEKKALKNADSISNAVGSKQLSIFEYNITYQGKTKEIVGKWKSNSIIKNGAIMLSNKNLKSLITIAKNHVVLGYNDSYCRESYIYQNLDSSLSSNVVQLHGSHINKILRKNLILISKFGKTKEPTSKDLLYIIDQIVKFHVFYYGKTDAIETMRLNYYSPNDYRKCSKTLDVIFDVCKIDNIQIYGTKNYKELKRFIKNIDTEVQKFQSHQTLTHNDLSNRNIYLNGKKCIFFDWELACFQNPEHDLVDLLVSNLHKMTDDEIFKTIQYYKKSLLSELKIKMSDKQYLSMVRFNLKEYIVNKLSMLRVFSLQNPTAFIDQLSINAARLLNLL